MLEKGATGDTSNNPDTPDNPDISHDPSNPVPTPEEHNTRRGMSNIHKDLGNKRAEALQ